MYRSWLLVFVLVCLPSSAAFAWNDLGHMIVAQLAYRDLSPAERLRVVQILRQHPHATVYFGRAEEVGIPEDEWLFLRAGTWCDFIRPPKEMPRENALAHPIHQFHRGPWHYINFPFRKGEVSSQIPAPLIAPDDEPTDIIAQLVMTSGVLNRSVAVDPCRVGGVTDAQNDAVRMCWLFHLIGDIHQPMHATAMVNPDLFPGPNFGDLGGNLVMIRTRSTSNPLPLHAFWDGQMGFPSGWRPNDNVDRLRQSVSRCRDQADLLGRNPAFAREKFFELSQTQFREWAIESYRLAIEHVYLDGDLKFTARKDLDEGRTAKDQVPILEPVVQERARAVANRRVALAGYRLADRIREILKD